MKPFHRPKRAAHSRALEIKTVGADGRFAGYASVFGNVDSQRDVVRKGAFLRSLRARKEPLQLLWQHQWNEPIGVIEKIFEDARGLYVEGRLLMEVARAKEALALMKSGIVKGLSIGYTVKSFRRDPDTGVRELLEIELFEVSLVTAPANVAAKVTVVKARDAKAAERTVLEQAIGRALPVALSIKSAAVRQQTLKVLGDAAYYNFRRQFLELERALHKAGYNPNQPRVPAGNTDGGQWTGGGGSSGTNRDSDRNRNDPLASNVPLDGIDRVYPETILIPALRIPRLAAAWRVWGLANRTGKDWTFGKHKSPTRWTNQINNRNWTPEEITHTIRRGRQFDTLNKPNPSNGATRYEYRGRYVVRDNKTKEILQISGERFKHD